MNTNAAALIELALPTLTNGGYLHHRCVHLYRLESLRLDTDMPRFRPYGRASALCGSRAGFCSGSCLPGHMYMHG